MLMTRSAIYIYFILILLILILFYLFNLILLTFNFIYSIFFFFYQAALNEVVARYYTNLAVIHGERKELSLEMALFENTMAQELLGTTNAATTPMIQPVNAVSQTQRNLQKLTMLDCLRRNLHSEVNLFEGAVDSLLNLLTPRQQAQLLLKVDLKSTSVLMLQGIYKRTELTSSSTASSTAYMPDLDYSRQVGEKIWVNERKQ